MRLLREPALFLALLILLVLVLPRNKGVIPSTVVEPPDAGVSLKLSTVDLPDPVNLEGVSEVTRLQVDVENLNPYGGSGTITMHRDELRFDEAGFATRTGGQAPLTLPVQLAIVGSSYNDLPEGRLYDIIFEGGKWFRQMRLLRSPDPGWHHRLILLQPGDTTRLERVLPLFGDRRFPDTRAVPKDFSLYGLLRKEGRFSQVRIRHSDCDGDSIQFDDNAIRLSSTGGVIGSTLVGYRPSPIDLRPFKVENPPPGGKLIAIQIAVTGGNFKPYAHGEWTYDLWLADTDTGPHRLLMKEKGVLHRIIPLEVEQRGDSVLPVEVIASLPADERAVVEEWYRTFGDQVRFRAYDGHVTFAHFESKVTFPVERIRVFSQLKGLELWQELSESDLGEISRMNSVRYMTLLGGYSDEGYRMLHSMKGLRVFWTYHRPNEWQKAALRDAIPGLEIH